MTYSKYRYNESPVLYRAFFCLQSAGRVSNEQTVIGGLVYLL